MQLKSFREPETASMNGNMNMDLGELVPSMREMHAVALRPNLDMHTFTQLRSTAELFSKTVLDCGFWNLQISIFQAFAMIHYGKLCHMLFSWRPVLLDLAKKALFQPENPPEGEFCFCCLCCFVRFFRFL